MINSDGRGGFNRHEQGDSGIAGSGNDFADEDEKDCEDFFGHFGS
jgi:hypothetical protein